MNWPERAPPPGQPHTDWPWTRAWVRCASSSSAAPTAQSCSPGWRKPAPPRAPRSPPWPGPRPWSWAGAGCEVWWWSHCQGISRRRTPRCESRCPSAARRRAGARRRGCSFPWWPERRELTHPSLFPHWCFPFLKHKQLICYSGNPIKAVFLWFVNTNSQLYSNGVQDHETVDVQILHSTDWINKQFTCSE